MCIFFGGKKMYIRTIVEDTLNENFPFLKNEHGLSLYIKYNDKNILFDAGPSDVLVSNSEKLNINLKDIDYLILSHGHFDHGGGIIPFLQVNSKAKIFIQRNSFKNYYFKNEQDTEYIGLNPVILEKYSDRIVLIDESVYNITNDIFLVPNIIIEKEITYNNKAMLINERANIFSQDCFEHEQAMIIKDNNKFYLFSGCSHKGIINIGNSIKRIFNISHIDYVIGGLHLVDDPISKAPIKNSELDEVAEYLKNNITQTYSCHCTGDPAYNYLRNTLHNKIKYLRTGSEITI